MDTFVYQVLVTCGNGDAWVAYESEDEASALARTVTWIATFAQALSEEKLSNYLITLIGFKTLHKWDEEAAVKAQGEKS